MVHYICLEGLLNLPPKFGFNCKENVISKFRNTGKLIPFVCEGVNMSLIIA